MVSRTIVNFGRVSCRNLVAMCMHLGTCVVVLDINFYTLSGNYLYSLNSNQSLKGGEKVLYINSNRKLNALDKFSTLVV